MATNKNIKNLTKSDLGKMSTEQLRQLANGKSPTRQQSGGSRSLETHPETGWSYIQSQQQVFFYFGQDIINPTPTNPNDVIGIFKNDICVGWDYISDVATGGTIDIGMMLRDVDIVSNFLTEEQCAQANGSYNSSNGVCTVPLCENSGTCNYPPVQSYFYPSCTFKYYNSQTGEISNLVNPDLTSNFLLNNNQIFSLNQYGGTWVLVDSDTIGMTIDIPDWGPNLVSFPLEMENNTPTDIFGTEGPIHKVITEEFATILMDDLGWVGSLTEIDPYKGYWVESNQSGHSINISGEVLGNPIYELNFGESTLISYPFLQTQETECTLNGLENQIIGIVGDGVAAVYSQHGWTGNLTSFEPGKGYWIKHNPGASTQFNWNQCSTTSSGQFTQFNFIFPKNWQDIGINNVFEYLENQLPTGILKRQPNFHTDLSEEEIEEIAWKASSSDFDGLVPGTKNRIIVGGGENPRWLLTQKEVDILKKGETPPGDLFKSAGGWECMGEAGGPPCFWVSDDLPIPDADQVREESFTVWYRQSFGDPSNTSSCGWRDGNCSDTGGITDIHEFETVQACCEYFNDNYQLGFTDITVGGVCYDDGGPWAGYTCLGDVNCNPSNGQWDDCDTFCTDDTVWSSSGGTWTKGDLNRDGNINVSDVVSELNYILQGSNLTGGELACTMWAADINNDQNIDVFDIIGQIDTILTDITYADPINLSVMHFNVGHLKFFSYKNLLESSENQEYCKDDCDTQGLCRQDHEFQIKNIIEAQQPDIITLTELISPNTCQNKPDCESQQQIPISSCYDWEDEAFSDPTVRSACMYSCDVWSTYLGNGQSTFQQSANDWKLLAYDNEPGSSHACGGYAPDGGDGCTITNPWQVWDWIGECECECDNGQSITDTSGFDCAYAHSNDLVGQFYYYLNCNDNHICDQACAAAYPTGCNPHRYCGSEASLEGLLSIEWAYYWDIWPLGIFCDGSSGNECDDWNWQSGDLPNWDCAATMGEQQTWQCFCESGSFRAQQMWRSDIGDVIYNNTEQLSQVRNLLGPNYSIVCNHGTGLDSSSTQPWYYDGISCIGVKTSVGQIENCGLGDLCMSSYENTDHNVLTPHPSAHTLEYPEDCPSMVGWENTTWTNVIMENGAEVKVVHTHPLITGTQINSKDIDVCRKEMLKQIFSGLGISEDPRDNVLVTGDFNSDYYRIKNGNLIDWGNSPGDNQNNEAIAFNTKLLRNWFNNWAYEQSVTPMIWETPQQPVDNTSVGFKLWNLEINVGDVELTIKKVVDEVEQGVLYGFDNGSLDNGGPADYYLLNLMISLPQTVEEGWGSGNNGYGMNFKFCGVPGDGVASTALSALGVHCNMNSATPDTIGQDPWIGFSGDINIVWKLTPPGTGGGKVWDYTDTDLSFEILDGPGEWFGVDVGELLADIVMGGDEDLDSYISEVFGRRSFADIMDIIDIDYRSLENYSDSGNAGYNLIDSTSYWHDSIQGSSRWTVHNVPDDWTYESSQLLSQNIPAKGDLSIIPEKTFQWLYVENTLDYIVSSFSDSRQCEVGRPYSTSMNGWPEAVTDHSYLFCNLESTMILPYE